MARDPNSKTHRTWTPALLYLGGFVFPLYGAGLYLLAALIRYKFAAHNERQQFLKGGVGLTVIYAAGLVLYGLNLLASRLHLDYSIGPLGYIVLAMWGGYTALMWMWRGDTYEFPLISRGAHVQPE